MNTNGIILKPIGIIHTPFKKPEGTPIQPGRSGGALGEIEVYPEYEAGLTDLDGFSHITLLYYFHLSKGFKLMVTPYLDDKERGLFATRAPRRPNPIGLSVVKLDKIEGNILHVVNVDMLDGTPLLDIKPYVRDFYSTDDFRIGWLEENVRRKDRDVADSRFHKGEFNGKDG
jgi:tRNA-Thr(GGU) m(6)t(6)A37 methyltransferase TsaA